eukprot:CAMPEP_0177675426 /NCGR_PEP_ID=MMETSP0447-20121125/27187_1 /TAXON_ID=0 /ORGANISM="Stygamoeba regulata, Strain BSH-02190019" /LENGTH=34 /DNA_ID= /DNA_START= /DNA_END= /DNA_ORIENTATION=
MQAPQPPAGQSPAGQPQPQQVAAGGQQQMYYGYY